MVAMNRDSRATRYLRANAPKILLGICLVALIALNIWQYSRPSQRTSGNTVSIGLTSDELASVRKLIRPAPPGPFRGSQVAINQVRDLEERLGALEKAVPLTDSLSAAANNDLRLLQRDIDALKERQIFQEEVIKDQRAEMWDQMKLLVGIMETINFAILGFFWLLVRQPKP